MSQGWILPALLDIGAALQPFTAATLLVRSGRKEAPGSDPAQRHRVMAQVFIDEAGDEVVAVVIARLQTQRQLMPSLARRLLQRLGLELLLEKVIPVTLVDQQRRALPGGCLGQQYAGIPLAPARPVVPR